jgi:hypothetical protein
MSSLSAVNNLQHNSDMQDHAGWATLLTLYVHAACHYN